MNRKQVINKKHEGLIGVSCQLSNGRKTYRQLSKMEKKLNHQTSIDVGSGLCMKIDVVFWIINVVTKSGNAPFRHFELNVDFESNRSRFKSRVPEPTSRLTSYRGRLVRIVDQNGGKFEHKSEFLFEKVNWVLYEESAEKRK